MKKYDLDDDFIEDLDEDEDDLYENNLYEEGRSSAEPDRRVLIGLGVLGAVIIVVVVILFVAFLNGSRKERESVETQLGLWEEVTEEELSGESPSDEDFQTEDSNMQEEKAMTTASPSPSAEQAAKLQTEVTVGALDDAQDPQSGGAAGNEQAGAEITVAPLGKDETQQLTMGIDVSKYQGTIDWAKVKASGVEFAMIRVGEDFVQFFRVRRSTALH